MAGLLDLPDFNSAAGQGLLAASLSLMGAQKMPGQKGAFGSALANAGKTYMDTRNQAGEQLQAQEYKRLQLDALKRKMEQEDQMRKAAQGAFRSPEMANAMSQGPMPDGSNMPEIKPGFDTEKYTQSLYGIDPLKAMDFERSLVKENPLIKVAQGETLYDQKGGGVVFTSPKEAAPTELSRLMTEMNALPPDSPMRAIYQQQIAKSTTHAPAASTNVNVNTEKSLLNNLAGGLGKSMTDARDGARSALSTISTVSRLNDALDSGKVMAGPGTSFRQYGLQVGNLLGVTGKDANEKLLNTRAAIQSLAQLELDAAQQMKGQGQITEAERSIIKRAASGDVDSMTTGELRVLSGVLDRSARTKIQGYNNQIKPLMSNPNAAALAPFLGVEEPPARAASSGVIRFDANGNQVR